MKLTIPQERAVQKAATDKHIALFWPTGCGKSLASLAVCSSWGAKRVLIIARKNNLLTWVEEGRIYGTKIYPITNSKVSKFPSGHVVVSHDLAARIYRLLGQQKFEAIVIDESYQVKNIHAKRTKAVIKLSEKIPQSIILNALPFSDQAYCDIYGQFRCLDSGDTYGTSLTRFREEYQYPHPAGFGWIDNPRMFTKLTKLASKKAITITKDECDLPSEVDKTFYVDFEPIQKKIYTLLRDQWAATFKRSEISTDYVVAKIAKLHQICGGIFRTVDRSRTIPTKKLCALEKLVGEVQGKVVVWAAYSPEIELVANYLTKLGKKVATYTGKSKSFPQGWEVLVAQQRMGVGLNELTNVPTAIYYSCWWSWYFYMQSRGRTSRLSSEHKNAFYFHIVIKGSIDELIIKNLAKKNSDAEKFVQLAKEFALQKPNI